MLGLTYAKFSDIENFTIYLIIKEFNWFFFVKLLLVLIKKIDICFPEKND